MIYARINRKQFTGSIYASYFIEAEESHRRKISLVLLYKSESGFVRSIGRISSIPLATAPRPPARKSGVLTTWWSFNLRLPFKCVSRQIHMENNHKSFSRGALIVLEGLDRSGKTSQSSRLLSYLEGLGYSVESWRFPDRNTGVGQMCSSYLANKSQLDDHTIHLLFSANRWEKRHLMETKLRSGITLIVDRYSYSGVAFSSAKGLDIEWCKAPEKGLLAPDLVLYLDIPPEKAAERGGYGGERYEQLDFQKKVSHYYQMLHDASWKIIDASPPVEEVEKQLREMVLDCVTTCQKGKALSKLWLS